MTNLTFSVDLETLVTIQDALLRVGGLEADLETSHTTSAAKELVEEIENILEDAEEMNIPAELFGKSLLLAIKDRVTAMYLNMSEYEVIVGFEGGSKVHHKGFYLNPIEFREGFKIATLKSIHSGWVIKSTINGKKVHETQLYW